MERMCKKFSGWKQQRVSRKISLLIRSPTKTNLLEKFMRAQRNWSQLEQGLYAIIRVGLIETEEILPVDNVTDDT